MTKHEVIYGGLGSGKSEYTFNIVNPRETFKFGVGGYLGEILILKIGSKRAHKTETRRRRISSKTVTLSNILDSVSDVRQSTLFIDEWTTFFWYSLFLPKEKVRARANTILDAIEENSYIQRGVYIARGDIPYLPFELYKKMATWNKVLFQRASKITRVEFGTPVKIK